MIPVTRAHLPVNAATHPGQKGKNNEDRYAVSAYILSEQDPIPALLAIVADGIGGHRAGEVAAEMAVEQISRMVSTSDASQPVESLQKALVSASRAIYLRAQSDPSLQGMGTTCACCWIIGNRLYTAALGDSRIYLISAGSIHQLTKDHTWIQEALDLGALTPEQARGHPNAHIIRRFLGSSEQPEPDIRLRLDDKQNGEQAKANQGMRLAAGDQLLLCTDGLTDLVNQDEILGVLAKNQGQDAANRLIELANLRGGHDNITVVLIKAQDPAGKLKQPASARRKLPLACLAAGLLTVLMASILVGIWFLLGESGGDQNAGGSTRPTSSMSFLIMGTKAPKSTSPAGIGSLGTTNPSTPINEIEERTTPRLSPTVRIATLTPWPTNTP